MLIYRGVFYEQVLLLDEKVLMKTDDQTFLSLFDKSSKDDIRFLMTEIAQAVKQNNELEKQVFNTAH